MLLWEGNNFFFISLEEGRKGREGKGRGLSTLVH